MPVAELRVVDAVVVAQRALRAAGADLRAALEPVAAAVAGLPAEKKGEWLASNDGVAVF